MSITTLGFGCGAITTVGFDATAVLFAITPGTRRRTHPLIVQVKGLTICRVTEATLVDLIADKAVEITSLESKLAHLECLLHLLENTDPLVIQIRAALDAKINEDAFDDKLSAADVALESSESALASLKSRISDLELQTRIYVAQQRA